MVSDFLSFFSRIESYLEIRFSEIHFKLSAWFLHE